MGSALRALLRIERPFDVILDKTMSEHGPAMIEDYRVNLAGGGPQRAPNHLAIEAHLARRPGENLASDLGHIPTLGQNHAVGHQLDLTGREPLQRCIPFGLWG